MADSSNIVSNFLQSEIARGTFPGGQYLVGEELQIIAEDALGLAVVEPERIPATLDTIYDFASLTKPLVTAMLVVKLSERGVLDLNAPLAAYLIEFNDQETREITLRQLLTHTSGLPNWRPLYLAAKNRADVPAAIARVLHEPQISQPPSEVIYSDLNYILLGFVLERVTGDGLDSLAKREIFDPLCIKRTMFNPPSELIPEIAATEHGQEFELANAIADEEARSYGESATVDLKYRRAGISGAPWRKNVIWGEVHDGNSNFMGGVAGHAGLFSTARDAFRMANQFLPGSEFLSPKSLALFTDNLTPGRTTSRSLAWILAETPDCSAGPALPPTAFGHNGFTGTSIWIDPNKRRVFILLTNRVHPRVDAVDMREIRQRFNTLAMEAVSGF